MNQSKVHVRLAQLVSTVTLRLVLLSTMLPTSVRRDFSVLTEPDIQKNSPVQREHLTTEQVCIQFSLQKKMTVEFCLSEWVSDWSLFNANWTIFQLYHGENSTFEASTLSITVPMWLRFVRNKHDYWGSFIILYYFLSWKTEFGNFMTWNHFQGLIVLKFYWIVKNSHKPMKLHHSSFAAYCH
jgi:hypothetical protein